MWDDFYIGNKPKINHTGATCISRNSNISENSEEYWYSDDLIGGRVNKSSKEGQRITQLIDGGDSLSVVEKYVKSCGLYSLSSAKLLKVIKKAEEAAYQRGWKDKTTEIKKVLGI